jgi:hypothetical protein
MVGNGAILSSVRRGQRGWFHTQSGNSSCELSDLALAISVGAKIATMLPQGSNYSLPCGIGEEGRRAIGSGDEQIDAPSVIGADNRWITDGGLLLFAVDNRRLASC